MLTEGDVSNVVPDGSVCVLQLQRRLPVAEQHLRSRVAGSPTLFELLLTHNVSVQLRLFDVFCLY